MSDRDGAGQPPRDLLAEEHCFELAINGRRLTPAQITAFKQLTGAGALEPGRYWLDADSGNMGLEGDSRPRLNVYRACLHQGMSRMRPSAPRSGRAREREPGDGLCLQGAG